MASRRSGVGEQEEVVASARAAATRVALARGDPRLEGGGCRPTSASAIAAAADQPCDELARRYQANQGGSHRLVEEVAADVVGERGRCATASRAFQRLGGWCRDRRGATFQPLESCRVQSRRAVSVVSAGSAAVASLRRRLAFDERLTVAAGSPPGATSGGGGARRQRRARRRRSRSPAACSGAA